MGPVLSNVSNWEYDHQVWTNKAYQVLAKYRNEANTINLGLCYPLAYEQKDRAHLYHKVLLDYDEHAANRDGESSEAPVTENFHLLYEVFHFSLPALTDQIATLTMRILNQRARLGREQVLFLLYAIEAQLLCNHEEAHPCTDLLLGVLDDSAKSLDWIILPSKMRKTSEEIYLGRMTVQSSELEMTLNYDRLRRFVTTLLLFAAAENTAYSSTSFWRCLARSRLEKLIPAVKSLSRSVPPVERQEIIGLAKGKNKAAKENEKKRCRRRGRTRTSGSSDMLIPGLHLSEPLHSNGVLKDQRGTLIDTYQKPALSGSTTPPITPIKTPVSSTVCTPAALTTPTTASSPRTLGTSPASSAEGVGQALRQKDHEQELPSNVKEDTSSKLQSAVLRNQQERATYHELSEYEQVVIEIMTMKDDPQNVWTAARQGRNRSFCYNASDGFGWDVVGTKPGLKRRAESTDW